MKCVCPMGGDRTCPNDCPLAVWADLSSDDRKTKRKPIAERLYRQGFAMEQIATQLGVSYSTIQRDLGNLPVTGKLKNTKTASNPKGAGRPKGSKLSTAPRPKTSMQLKNAERDIKIIDLANTGMSTKRISAEVHLGERNVAQIIEHERIKQEGKAEAFVELDLVAGLSATAKEKLEAAIRVHKRKLDAAFDHAVAEQVQKQYIDYIMPHHNEKFRQSNLVINSAEGIFTRAEYRKILACLHPDSRHGASERMFSDAFATFESKERVLIKTKERQIVTGPTLPRTMAEWTVYRRQMEEQKRAARATNKSLKNGD